MHTAAMGEQVSHGYGARRYKTFLIELARSLIIRLLSVFRSTTADAAIHRHMKQRVTTDYRLAISYKFSARCIWTDGYQ